MLNHKQVIAWILLCALPTFSAASVYKITHPDGSVSYSDQPSDNAQQIITPVAPSSSPAPKQKPKTSSSAQSKEPEKEDKPVVYTSFSIASPQNGATIRANDGKLTVSIKIVPGIVAAQGDLIPSEYD